MCGDDSRDIAGLPIDQIQHSGSARTKRNSPRWTISPTHRSRPRRIFVRRARHRSMLTAPGRLAAMQQRIEAMMRRSAAVQPPLEKFYGSAERRAEGAASMRSPRISAGYPPQQKAQRVACPGLRRGAACRNAMADRRDRGQVAPERSATRQPQGLQDASAKAAETLKAACPADEAVTPPRAARRHRQAARYHAASGQAGARRPSRIFTQR